MDNFRHRYRPQSGRSGSTDGFVNPSSHRRPAHPQPGLSRPAHTSYQPTSKRVIGDFKAPDGFHPRSQPQQTIGGPEGNPLHNQIGRHPDRNAAGRIQVGDHKSQKAPKRKKRFGLHNPFKRENWNKRTALKTAGALMVLVIVVGGYLGGKAYLKSRDIFKGGGGAAALDENVDPTKLNGEGDGRVNILLLGRGGEGHEGADLTDTIIVASINPIQKEAALLSIPRDLYVRTSGGSYSKVNSVFPNAKNKALASISTKDASRIQKSEDAGFKAVEDVIKTKIGIPIHYHAIVDFEGFKKAVDTVGGIDITVGPNDTVQEKMRINGQVYQLSVSQGNQHLDGMKALAYSRSRYTSARGDFSRSERQRLVLVGLKNKVFTLGTFGNPFKINQLLSDFGNHVKTNLSTNEVKRLYDIGNQIDSSKIASVGLADPPNNYITTDMINGQSVVVPRAGLDNYKEIQNYVRNRLKDGFLAQENATVAVLNGTSIAGLATRTSEDLKSYGYNISQVSDAPTKNYQTTTVVDLRNGSKKYTKNYLEKRFGTTAIGSLPDPNINPGTADFVIILGQNEQARLGN